MPKKVLIVDATISTWQSIVASLGNTDYEILYSSTLSDAVEKLQAQCFDLIIVDLGWPRLEGMSFILQLSQVQPEALVLAVSEFADRELEQEAQRNGAQSCLIKPVSEEDLLRVLATMQTRDNLKQDVGYSPSKNIEQTLLRGFSPDQQWDFRMIGSIRNYQVGDIVPMNDESGAMIWVEKGRLMVCYNDVPVEGLAEGEFWGEAAFVNPSSIITYLVALEDVQIRHFSRKRMIEFFTYHDETLTKRYMINLINCLHLKWNRTITRLVMTIAPSVSKDSGDVSAP